MDRVGSIERNIEWAIIMSAIRDFHCRPDSMGRAISDGQHTQLSHFAKQGVKVRLK